MTTSEKDVDVNTTQAVVPDLIASLYKANIEFQTSSSAPTKMTVNDPHLRLRRTLTPASPIKGMSRYNDAQFMIQGSTGKRTTLSFSALGNDFHMDAYIWGAEEADATHRLVSLHGISPGASRTRWHPCGERLSKAVDGVRFVALDWHSIDRTDVPQDAFLTMLPKHFWTTPKKESLDELLVESTPELAAKIRATHEYISTEHCPRSIDEAASIFRAIVEQGLGWGTDDKPFIPCIKSWSGGVGVRMLATASQEKDSKLNVKAAIIMHAAAFEKDEIHDSVKDIPALICWAKDDPLVPYKLTERYLVHPGVKLMTYEKGGHHNFDGSGNLPSFDDEIINWIQTLS